VLQNEKYIAFADDNTVEVIALSRLDEALKDPKDRKTETYDAKDEAGNPVKYMKEYAGMTSDQLLTLNSSPAGQYNKTGHIPYVSIVDPYTLAEVKSMPGGAAAGGLMDAVKEAKDKLNKDHGPSVRRTVMWKVEAEGKTISADLKKDGVAKALPEFQKLEASVAKEHDAIKAKVKEIGDAIIDAAKAQLDSAEGKIAAGDVKGAKSILSPLSSALKGTELEARVKELLDKTKPAPEPAK
jgi:hypothetical protein